MYFLCDAGTRPGMPYVSAHDLAQRMAELARSVAAPRDLDEVLSTVTTTTVELLDGAEKVAMSRSLRGSLGAGIDIDDLRYRHPRINRFHRIEQPAGPSPDVQGGELVPRNPPRDGVKHPAVEGLLYSLHQPGRAGGSE